jgi:UDP-N-acetylmuramoyl-tripeptide--D-alanyl-D-alanine ligase
MQIAELAAAAGGSLLRGEPATVVDSYGIDTRQLRPASAFFALAGTKADGHDFLPDAARAGAAVAVIEREPPADAPAPPALVLVDDARSALGRCGSWVRKRFASVRWIAITGSNGKTTTKEMVANALATERRVHRTPGNLNNELGVPLSLLAMPDDAEVTVLELGMSGPGEIAALTRLADPDVGMVTNVRAVHMAFFRNLDDVAAAKGELFATMRDDATSVVNLDDLHVRVQATRHVGPRVTYGRHAAADFHLESVLDRFLPGAALAVRHRESTISMQLRIGGAHAAQNALAALAAAVAAGADPIGAARGIETTAAGPGRGRTHRLAHDIVVVDDTYNSNPPAIGSVLETLRQTETPGRKVLVMGDMLELGPMEAALHREAGKRAAGAGVHVLVGVGPLAREAAEAGRRAGVPEVHHHPDSHLAARAVPELLRPSDLVIVKGSRGVHLGRVVRAVIEAFGERVG